MSASTLIMGKPVNKLGSDLKKQTYAFLEKLTEDDSVPGLHIEPIANCRDPRVRTGRVTQQYRAVLFRLDGPTLPTYVFVGVWNHDDAITKAKTIELTLNPVNGVSEVHFVEETKGVEPATHEAAQAPAPAHHEAPVVLGYSAAELHDGLGLDVRLAEAAARATTEDELMELAGTAVEWQGLALIDLAAGTTIDDVKAKLGLDASRQVPAEATDQDILDGFDHPAARLSYAYIEDNDELRRVIEDGDFGAWRVFLHPEQRRYAERHYGGAFRLSGGAGTGKTVVLIHRAARLAAENPAARVLLTTFTTNLAAELGSSLRRLAPRLPQVAQLGAAGVHVNGIDALASAVLKGAGQELAAARAELLGSEDGGVGKRTEAVSAWRSAIDAAGDDLATPLRVPAFFDAEYGSVILPNRITTLAGYLKVRRPGRGVRLNRAERTAVWKVMESYRLSGRAGGSLDFREAAALASVYLDRVASSGKGRLFDHVLVDEGQDLTPTHWQLIRALVSEGDDDVFIAEDSHQRIYGRRLSLGQFGLKVVGRSRRLTLNYRTTEQNLRFAMRILEPGNYQDLEDGAERSTDYRSARSGPDVRMLGCATAREELDQAARLVSGWIEEVEAQGQARESIAILVRDRYERDRVVSGLAERDVTVRPVDREAVPTGLPVAMTMHRAKGTEFLKVLLFGVGAGSVPKGYSEYEYSDDEVTDALLRERSLLYVASTRARDELAVSWAADPSPLLSTAEPSS